MARITKRSRNFGTPMRGLESPERKRRRAKARKREEAAWAARSGPVLTYFDPSRIQGGAST
jgi:hypothetical protein